MVYVDERENAYADAIAYGFEDMFGKQLLADAFGGKWEKNERSRAPYTDSWSMGENGITLFASPNLTHCCVEISGQGCERLIALSLLADVLRCSKERITRIDIACDIETEVSPMDFVAEVSHERMRTSGQVISETGETCYVGSKKSDRYARVYRYNKPHPRAHLLRVEHVFRKDYAKKVASEITVASLENIAAGAGLAFGWEHPVWNTGKADVSDLSLVFERGNTGSTVFWLVHSCAAAFRRLCADGTISDPQAFLDKYFINDPDA
jgi:hypothetical protein